MAETLIERIAAQISPELIQKASVVLGEPEASVAQGFQTAIPAVLAKFAEKAETAEGATELLSMVNESSGEESVIEDPSSLLDLNLDNPAQDRGQALLGTLFGRQAPEIVSGLASDAGVQPVSMGRLMSVVSPLLLGELGQKFGGNATADALVGLVATQRPGIFDAIASLTDGRRTAEAQEPLPTVEEAAEIVPVVAEEAPVAVTEAVEALDATLGHVASEAPEKIDESVGVVTSLPDEAAEKATDAIDAVTNLAGDAAEKAEGVASVANEAVGKTFDVASDAVESVAGGLPKWVVPAVALAVLALLGGYFFRARTAPKPPDAPAGQTTSADATPDPGAATPEAGSASPEATPDAEATPAPDASGLTEVKVGDNTLKAAPDGIEDQLIAFLNDPSQQVDETTWFNFDRLLFDTGKATLKPESKLQLQNVAEILKGFPRVSVKIGGYTDNTGSPAANKKLSTDRAASVVKGLVALGIAKTRLTSEGYGDLHPIASNDTAEGREQNRRIAIRVTKK